MQQMPQISPAYDRNQRRAHLWPEQGLSGGRSGAGQGKCAAGPEHTRPDVQHLGYKKRDLHANTLVNERIDSTLHELWTRQTRKCPANLSHLKLIPDRIPEQRGITPGELKDLGWLELHPARLQRLEGRTANLDRLGWIRLRRRRGGLQ